HVGEVRAARGLDRLHRGLESRVMTSAGTTHHGYTAPTVRPARHRQRRRLELANMPLEKPPIPSRKPKSYQRPTLGTAYTRTASVNRLTMNVNGARKPCHRP